MTAVTVPPHPGQRVALRSFLNTTAGPAGTHPADDFWRLIGRSGLIVDTNDAVLGPSTRGPRVLVQFDEDPAALGLHCHNDVPRGLWILVSDLVAAPER